MKWYLTTDDIDWGDEFDVNFGELIDAPTYEKYRYLTQVLGSYSESYWFGTNQSFDDFEYLGWDFVEISEEEAAILKKYGLPNGYSFIDHLFDHLEEDMMNADIFEKDDIAQTPFGSDYLNESLDEMPFHKFADCIDKYAKYLDE